MAFEAGLLFLGTSGGKLTISCWQPAGLLGLSNLIMMGRWDGGRRAWWKFGGGGGMREEVEERMPPQSAPCRQTHVAVGSRVLVMTSENQQEPQADSQSSQRRWVTTGENIICTDIKLTICNVFNHNYNALTTVLFMYCCIKLNANTKSIITC